MNNGFRRSTIVKIFYGLVLLAIGIAFAGSALGFWSFDIFFKGWWCVLLMVLAVADMCSHGFREWDVFVFVIGAVLATGLFILSVIFLTGSGYNPFISFRF